MNIAERARIKQRRKIKTEGLGQLYDILTDILFRHNPVGLPRTPGVRDDYGSPVGTLIPSLETAKSADEVQIMLLIEMARWYGKDSGPESMYGDISRDIWKAWLDFKGLSKASSRRNS